MWYYLDVLSNLSHGIQYDPNDSVHPLNFGPNLYGQFVLECPFENSGVPIDLTQYPNDSINQSNESCEYRATVSNRSKNTYTNFVEAKKLVLFGYFCPSSSKVSPKPTLKFLTTKFGSLGSTLLAMTARIHLI